MNRNNFFSFFGKKCNNINGHNSTEVFFHYFYFKRIYLCMLVYTIIIYTYRVYVCTSNQKKSTVWRNRLYVLLYFIPNTFACKSVFNFVKILSSYIILTLHIDIEYLDTPCFVSFVFFILFSPIIFGLSLVSAKAWLFQISKYSCKGHELCTLFCDLHRKPTPVCP